MQVFTYNNRFLAREHHVFDGCEVPGTSTKKSRDTGPQTHLSRRRLPHMARTWPPHVVMWPDALARAAAPRPQRVAALDRRCPSLMDGGRCCW